MRWLFGEDVLGFRIGSWQFLNMMDPPMFGHPGKLSDPQLVCSGYPYDYGDTHTNNGIPNHAYALMVDGGTYNGSTITGIGLTKAGKIEYRALTQYLGALSSFQDNYDAVRQACADLIGTVGITAADCGEVQKALDAVEMGYPWPCFCGNGVVDAGEQCDDGNRINRDGCSSRCLIGPSYKCYQGKDLKNPEFAKTLADTTDQLTTEQVKVKKVRFACLPVDAGGGTPPDSAGHLTCYQVKAAKRSPKPHVEVTTQFQTSRFELKKPQLLCTPSTLAILP